MLRAAFIGACTAAAIALPAQEFETPTKLMAGEKPIGYELNGRERLYPSPVLQDIDADGTRDLMIADLFGNLTWCKGSKDGWSDEAVFNGADGKPLKFSNW
jgi:hypothetical protein